MIKTEGLRPVLSRGNDLCGVHTFSYSRHLKYSEPFYATVIQVKGLANHKTMFSCIRKDLSQVRNLTVVIHSFDVLELLILTFAKGLFV